MTDRAHIETCWYGDRPPPLHWRLAARLYGRLVQWRRAMYRLGLLRSHHPGCPVIVVGNVTVGGTGKTPLVIWLVDFLQQNGWRPGIVSRGYLGRRKGRDVLLVDPDTNPAMAGDEPVLIARDTGLPVAVHRRRSKAADYLVERLGVNVVIADDGLQHYSLARDIEICVVEGERRFGNGRLIPAGPLREPVSRVEEADFVVANGPAEAGEMEMRLEPAPVRSLVDGRRRALAQFPADRVHAVAGIGNPERFFAMLEANGLAIIRHPFPDHHAFAPSELAFGDGLPVLMTEKDAVRIKPGTVTGAWAVPVQAELPEAFRLELLELLKADWALRG